jgi:cell wall-associated NlpC family hydrolase
MPVPSSPPTSVRVVRRRPARVVAAGVLVLATALTGAFASTAGASTGGSVHQEPSLEQQASTLQDQIEASDIQISALAEKLDAALAKQHSAQQTVADAEAQIAVAKAEVKRISKLVEENLASLYRRTLRGETGASFFSGDWNEILRRGQYANAQNSRDDSLLEQLNAAQQDLAATRSEAAKARDTAAAEGAQIAQAKAAVETARASQQSLLDKVTGQIAAAVAAEQARRAAALATTITSKAGVATPNVGPPNGSASQAIAYARAVIGSPYSTNPRMGPSYDCSGLVFKSWEAAGVSIPSTSGSMYAALPKVPIGSAQPGDLIFWGSGGSSHVALYIGGGQIIDAGASQGVSQRAIWGSPEPLAGRVV